MVGVRGKSSIILFNQPLSKIRTYVLITPMKKPRKTQAEKDLEQGISLAFCPRCGRKEYYFFSDVDLFFICPDCGVYSWLRYKYIDQNCLIVNGLQLVLDP